MCFAFLNNILNTSTQILNYLYAIILMLAWHYSIRLQLAVVLDELLIEIGKTKNCFLISNSVG